MRGRIDTPRILIPDTWHFGHRQFRLLHDLAAAERIRLWTERSRRAWWRRHGDYRPLAGKLAAHLRALAALGPAELIAHEHHGIEVFGCARSELLRMLLPRWVGEVGPNRDPQILDRIFASARDREDLLRCMAAARDWIDFWLAALERKGPFSHAVVYSGSAIYARALQEVGRRRALRLFAIERFPVGNLYYFEERATPLPNRSLLADADWYRRLALPEDIGRREQLRADAYRRLAPDEDRRRASQTLTPPLFARRDRGVVLVLGQAADDVALIETPLPELSAPAVYRRLIGGILERTGLSVVFRGDPYLLEEWRGELPLAQRERLRLIDDAPVRVLLNDADWVVSLSSRDLIWACRAGLKPAQIGRSFLGGKGFTHDLADADAVVEALAAGHLEGRLSLAEYRAFEEFLMRALVLHLVPNDRTGAAQIAPRLAVPNHVPTLEEARPPLCIHPSRRRIAAEALVNPVAAIRLALDRRRPAEE